MRTPVVLPALVLAAAACNSSPSPSSTSPPPPPAADEGAPPPSDPTRKPAVPDDHPLAGRFEGGGFADACSADADCHVGGCSQEVCSAEEGVVTTCEVLAVGLPEGTQCGCVDGACKWWNEGGATLPPAPDPATATQPCGGKPCDPPAECIEYFGIAGAAGPKLSECAIRCKPDEPKCPDGMRCLTIADGPGPVCRPEGAP